jgi:hypothetical protein
MPKAVGGPGAPLDYNEYTPAEVDARVCGCTKHNVHADCEEICGLNYCGYFKRSAMRQRVAQQADRVLAGKAAPFGDSSYNPAAEMRRDLENWWLQLANAESTQVVDKAVEYGSRDLVDIGRDLADCMHRQVSDQEAAELGVYFYLRGKMSRWTDAVRRGQLPSDDTLKDIGVYVRMAQRIRTHGGWPGKAE